MTHPLVGNPNAWMTAWTLQGRRRELSLPMLLTIPEQVFVVCWESPFDKTPPQRERFGGMFGGLQPSPRPEFWKFEADVPGLPVSELSVKQTPCLNICWVGRDPDCYDVWMDHLVYGAVPARRGRSLLQARQMMLEIIDEARQLAAQLAWLERHG